MDPLKKKIGRIEKVINTNNLTNKRPTLGSIAKYYKINKLAYTLFHNNKGFVHMGISKGGVYKEKDLLEQPKLVAKYIDKYNSKDILELACGKGANSNYLANKFKNTQFTGLDLPNGQASEAKKTDRKYDNFNLTFGDYHNLKQFNNKSFDLVFIIEALCHSKDKERVVKEVKRVLKEEGIFIVIDGYLRKSPKDLTNIERRAKKLVEKSMSVASFEQYKEVKETVREIGFKLLQEEDKSKNIVPTLKRFEGLSKKYFKLGFVSRLVSKLLPRTFVNNAVAGYLMPNLIKKEVACYYISVFQKMENY